MTVTATETMFIVSTKALRKALSFVGGAILANPIAPILEDVLCEIQDGVLTLTGSDLNTTLTAEVVVESGQSFSICIPHKPLLALISSLPEQPITIEVEQDDTLPNAVAFSAKIKTSSGQFDLECDEPLVFPSPTIEPEDESKHLLFSGEDRNRFVDGVNRVSFAVAPPNTSKDNYEGICWVDNDIMTFDGFRAAKSGNLSQSVGNHPYVLPAKIAPLLVRLVDLVEPEDSLAITLTTKNILCKTGKYSLRSRLRDNPFPDFRSSIPEQQPQHATLPKDELMATLKRVLLMGNSITNFLSLESTDNKLLIVAGDVDLKQQGKEFVTGEISEGIRIGLNGKFLLDCLQSVKGSVIHLQFDGQSRAVMMSSDEGDYITFLAPVSLDIVLKSQGRK